MEAMKGRKAIEKKQHGFIKDKPGLTVPVAAFGKMTLPMGMRRAVLAIFLNFDKAFYVVCHGILVASLERCGLNWWMTSWVENCLEHLAQSSNQQYKDDLLTIFKWHPP